MVVHDSTLVHDVGPVHDIILVICWHLLSTGETYTDLGADYFEKRHATANRQRRLVAQLEAMGHKVTLEPAAA